ncbi:hypothetical protein KSP39_PZI020060 [Platanthera zijinensis]|uniref:Uncharacterized protein n=1 Tax=Platanthera zijinensis TaxID=2320716 RepID=A0AAP0B079_9ASPA
MLGAFFFLTHQSRAFLLVLASLLKRLHLFLCRCAASCHMGISSSPRHPATGKAAQFGALKEGYMFDTSTGLARIGCRVTVLPDPPYFQKFCFFEASTPTKHSSEYTARRTPQLRRDQLSESSSSCSCENSTSGEVIRARQPTLVRRDGAGESFRRELQARCFRRDGCYELRAA